MRGTILSAAVLAAALGGCYTTGTVGYTATYSSGASSDVYVSTPDLVAVSPGVQVVADYDEPVFYSDGFYWRFYNNGWYRSNNYATGWYYYERPPVAVLRIERPYAYVRYRPQGYVARSRGRYRPPQTIQRDHRDARPEPVVRERPRAAPAYQQPAVRDHRDVRPAAPPPAAAPPRAEPRRSDGDTRDHRRRDDGDTRDHRRRDADERDHRRSR